MTFFHEKETTIKLFESKYLFLNEMKKKYVKSRVKYFFKEKKLTCIRKRLWCMKKKNFRTIFSIFLSQTGFGSSREYTFSFYTSHFLSPSLKLTDWHFKFVYLLLKSKLQTFIIIQSNIFKKSQKLSLFWLKTPLEKHLVTFDNKSADIESKQGLKATGLYIISN